MKPAGAAPAPPLARAALALVGVKAAMHVATAVVTPYEFHRDEFLYFSMGTHMRLFRMDFPPFIALVSELLRHSVGVTVAAYRLVPAMAGTATMILALLIARALGGGRRAQGLTAVACLTCLVLVRPSTLFQPVVFDQLWWTLALYALVRLDGDDDRRWWLLVGVAGGLGLLTKFSIGFLGLGVVAGVLLTRRRRDVATPWPWLALLLVLLLGSPSLVGQVRLGYPAMAQLSHLRGTQLQRVTYADYVLGQLLWGPAVLLGGAGLWALLGSRDLKRWRTTGWACLGAFLLLAMLHGKAYYIGPIYPTLIAAGAVAVERLPRPGLSRAIAWGGAALIVAYFALAFPLGLEVLPPPTMARYASRMGLTAMVSTNYGTVLRLPQDYADMLGWREKADAVARAWRALPDSERAQAVLFGDNYGQAGALDLYGRRLGLPPVVSLAGSFAFFGPGERPGRVVLTLGVDPGGLRDVGCASVRVVEWVKNPWGVEEEQNVPVALCRHPATTMQELWAQRVGVPGG